MASFLFKWCNPFWWVMMIPYQICIGIPLAILKLPLTTWRAVKTSYTWTMKTFTSWWSRAIILSMAIWVAIPGSLPLTFYTIAHWAGYGEQADTVVSVASTVAGAMWEAGKFAWGLALA